MWENFYLCVLRIELIRIDSLVHIQLKRTLAVSSIIEGVFVVPHQTANTPMSIQGPSPHRT